MSVLVLETWTWSKVESGQAVLVFVWHTMYAYRCDATVYRCISINYMFASEAFTV